MANLANQSSENGLSQFSIVNSRRSNITLQHLQNPPGEGSFCLEAEHTLFISLAPRPIKYMQVQDGKTYTGLYQKGEILITPANTPLFVRWEGEENCLQIQLPTEFIQSIARETLEQNSDRLELLPEFQIGNPHIEATAMMLFAEFQQEQLDNGLYLDSLTNVLAVNLLRHHTASKPRLPIYEGGLPPRQLSQVLDYIDTYLDRNIKLADLAKLLDISSFHFSRLFKQSIGITPHQYLSQQRVERAKQLLKTTDRLIVDIALECGFTSHSHLSKQFRQLTSMTPKAYRITYKS
ncbi:MAG: AraC family transcriptional regulator [Xenococcaceae cyanobacterium MO_167.B52]|nr:AraC family transcriptional regulator [Xenococcaceae cyanobacterium MO_167.B52]